MTNTQNALLGPIAIRELAERFGVNPTKSKGQNFLHDAGTVRKIVRQSGVVAGQRVVEVGPGLGSLTLGLLEIGADVVAVELDTLLAAELAHTVAERMPDAAGRIEVVTGDALAITELPNPQPTAFVANLPYNVSVPILLTFLERFPTLERIMVMVQLEVADRIVAHPGNKVYGIPSVKTAWYGTATRSMKVGRNVFWPAPNVDSALVFIKRGLPPQTSASREQVFAVIDAAFAHRRKTLRQNLVGLAGSAAQAQLVLETAGVDPSFRGERLTVNQFAAIAEALDLAPNQPLSQNVAEG